mmetsp:Transcript_54174/g.105988  ORF Transcript_54174/g.105988 Transcript_54174/m.105988 type:complete len:261 (+) Transcript_54174:1355-2137(+)
MFDQKSGGVHGIIPEILPQSYAERAPPARFLFSLLVGFKQDAHHVQCSSGGGTCLFDELVVPLLPCVLVQILQNANCEELLQSLEEVLDALFADAPLVDRLRTLWNEGGTRPGRHRGGSDTLSFINIGIPFDECFPSLRRKFLDARKDLVKHFKVLVFPQSGVLERDEEHAQLRRVVEHDDWFQSESVRVPVGVPWGGGLFFFSFFPFRLKFLLCLDVGFNQQLFAQTRDGLQQLVGPFGPLCLVELLNLGEETPKLLEV